MSLRFPFHPSVLQLESFAAEGRVAVPSSLRRHFGSCVRCQDDVRALLMLRRAIREMPAPPMSSGLLTSIERRIADDDLVLLPPSRAAAPAGHRPGLTRLLPIAAAMLLAIVLVWPRRAPLEAGSTVGELTVTTHAPSAPNTLAIRYRPSTTLSSFDSVIVRAGLYRAGQFGAPSQARYVVLRRDDVFGGDVTLPPEAMLASLTLASPDGKYVDDNDGRSWEFVARDSVNRPKFDGLWVQSALHSFDDWERSLAASREMVRFYPEQPAGVRFVLGASLQLAGASAADSVIREWRPVVEALHRRYASQAASADIVWEMAMLADQIGDTAMARYWYERARREYPRDAGTIQLGVFAIFKQAMSDQERMRALDRLWDETGGGAIQLAADAFHLAEKLGDPTTIERWGDRLAAFAGWGAAPAITYIRYAALRPKGEALLRDALRALSPLARADWSRALKDNAGKEVGTAGQWQLAALGDALLRDGQIVPARDTLHRAAAARWDAGTLSLLGDAALAAADTAEAARAYAWVIADWRTTSARADSVRTRLGPWTARADFQARIAEGRTIVRTMALASTYWRPLNRAATFADASGARRSLADVLPAGISVIAVISRRCAPSLADMPSLQRMRDRLASLGVPVLAVVGEEPSEDARKAVTRAGYTGSLGFDDRAEVSRGLRQYGTPQYFVVEDGKTVRADSRRASDLGAVIDALRVR